MNYFNSTKLSILLILLLFSAGAMAQSVLKGKISGDLLPLQGVSVSAGHGSWVKWSSPPGAGQASARSPIALYPLM